MSRTFHAWWYDDGERGHLLGTDGQAQEGDGLYFVITEDEAEARDWHADLLAGRIPPIPTAEAFPTREELEARAASRPGYTHLIPGE
jgi:hypothetical protein